MRYFVVIFFLIFISVTLPAQSLFKKNKGNYYVLIDSGFVNPQPEAGATMKGIYEHDTLKKIECWYAFNFGDLQRDFHYWNGQLIMVMETQRLYNTTASNPMNPDSVKPNYQGRYLFEGGLLKSIKQDGHFSFMDTPADKNTMQDTFLKMSTEYISLLDGKRAIKKYRVKMKK